MTFNNIKITYELLNKDENKLSIDEKKAIEKYRSVKSAQGDRLAKINQKLVKECKTLCSGYEHNPVPEYGWIYPIEELCYELEAMNILYRKYGLSAVLQQSKEKYATLRFYVDIVRNPTGFRGLLYRLVSKIETGLEKVDYGWVTVTDKEGYNSVNWREITKEQFDNKRNEYNDEFVSERNVKVVNSKAEIDSLVEHDKTIFMVEENGKYFYSYVLHHPRETHIEFRKHKFLKSVLNVVRRAKCLLGATWKTSGDREVLYSAFGNRVACLISDAEHKCTKYCQECGGQFYSENPVCETQGYITYLCERCAESSGYIYSKNGKLFREGNPYEDKK